jgi:NADH:ubiquinone oxidoreductase subunit 6 (subunit J)
MDEKSMKTSLWQRIAILAAAVLLIGGTLLTYVIVVLNGSSTDEREDLVNQLSAEYTAKGNEINAYAEKLSEKYFKDFVGYKSQVKAYNSANANAAGLETTDLKVGTGRR